MRITARQHLKKFLAAALFGSVVLASAGAAQAHDWDHDWDRHHERGWREHEWREHEREREWRLHHSYPRYVEQRPVYVTPPVVYAPPAYSAPGPSSLNLNFNIPLQ
jgi:hypothetical protein